MFMQKKIRLQNGFHPRFWKLTVNRMITSSVMIRPEANRISYLGAVKVVGQIHNGLRGYTDRKNVTNFLYLVLHLACKVTCYFLLFSLVLVSVLRTSINVLSKSKSKNYVTWIANLTKLFLSV